MLRVVDLFDLTHSIAGDYLGQFEYPWQALPGIGAMILELGATLGEAYIQPLPSVWIHRSATVAPSASVTGPCIIGPQTQIRHCAYLRGNVLVGENCVVSNSSELKNCILFDGAQIPHFNYVGDSIVGFCAHMGGGAITSNLKGDKTEVVIRRGGEMYPTGLRKCGAMIGDFADVGANALLNPGTVIGRHSRVYPCVSVRGVVPARCIFKNRDNIVPIR